MSEGTYTAVLDRFEVTQSDDELAVILLEAEGEVVDELVLTSELVPAAGRHEDAVFEISIDDEEVTEIAYRPDETRQRREAAQSRFDRLARRPSNTDDEGNE